MFDLSRSLGLWALMSIALFLGAPAYAGGQEATCGCPDGIELEGQPWVRMVPVTAPVTSAYLTLGNTTDRDIRIITSESPVARSTELHGYVASDTGVNRMREVEAITIPANSQVELKPGGLHIMMFDLVNPLKEGRKIPIVLGLEGMERIRVQAEVRRMDRGRPAGGGHQHHH